MDEDENPCIGVCMIGDDGRCVGCGRTEDEIYGPAADPPAEGGSGPG